MRRERGQMWAKNTPLPTPQAHASPQIPLNRPTKSRARVATAIRFRDDLHDKLIKEAEARDVSVNWLVNMAVADYLDRLIPADEMRWTR